MTAGGLPGHLRVAVVAEIVVATAITFLLLMVVNSVGWPRAIEDLATSIAVVAAPLVATIACAVLAHRQWRRGRRRLAMACIVAPGLALLGMVLTWSSAVV